VQKRLNRSNCRFRWRVTSKVMGPRKRALSRRAFTLVPPDKYGWTIIAIGYERSVATRPVPKFRWAILLRWLLRKRTYGTPTGHFTPWLTAQSGTVSRISSGTRQSALTLSDVCWRRICLRHTSACSALEVDNFMRYINLLTYLLTVNNKLHAHQWKRQ